MEVISFIYWDDCVDAEDLEAMWTDPSVRAEWLNAGETKGSKVNISRDPEGQPYLTPTEMKAIAGIVVQRHFASHIDADMVCTIADIESNRQPLSTRYDKKSKELLMGIMQLSQKTAEWLVKDMDYRSYEIKGDPKLLYKPFVNVYLGAAYLNALSNYDHQERSEEFMIRAYKGGIKKATHKSTLQYWNRYLSVKQSRHPSRNVFDVASFTDNSISSAPASTSKKKDPGNTTWESRASSEDIEEMWKNPVISKEWTRSGEKKGQVRISHDMEKRPYLSRTEMKVVADIILSKYFTSISVTPIMLSALADMVSMRNVDGIGQRTGLMGIDYPTARWLYKNLGYNAYTVESAEDLRKPFVSVYFGAAYLAWLSEYEGRKRTPQFIVQAYLTGPQSVKTEETGPIWVQFKQALSRYEEETEKDPNSCPVL